MCISEPSSGTDPPEERGQAAVAGTATSHPAPARHRPGAGSEDAGEAAAMPVSMATSALGARWR